MPFLSKLQVDASGDGYPDAVIYEFSETGIEPVSYRDSQPYQMTSRFLKNPEAMLEKLLSD